MEIVLILFSILLLGEARQLQNGTSTRSLQAFELVGLYEGCPQGKQGLNSPETQNNHHDWWENNWGRSGGGWPKRGFASCWANRGGVCALPDQDHVVCLPGSRRGSTVNKGWALDPKSQSCQPGVHCLYACEPGYYWTTFNDGETSNYDVANGPQKGHCDGTWDYGTSTHGIYCNDDGSLAIPEQPLCSMGESYVFAENRLDTHVFVCQTVFPGHEIFLIPTLINPGETVMITTQPKHFWSGPSYGSPTHGDIYVGFAGADIMESCTWDEISPSGASLLPYEIGSGVEDNGAVYSTHYFYQQPNSEVPKNMVGYELDLECQSSEWGICGDVFRSSNVVKVDVFKKPSPGSTSVKFIFNPPTTKPRFGEMYHEPSRNYLDPSWISSMTHFPTYDDGGSSFGRRLMEADGAMVYADNQHSEPMLMCERGEDTFDSKGAIIHPGEKMSLNPASEYHINSIIGGRGTCGETELPWILYTGDLEEGTGARFSHKRNAKSELLGVHNFTTTIKCSSAEDHCRHEDGRSVSVVGQPDSGLSITFKITSSKLSKQATT